MLATEQVNRSDWLAAATGSARWLLRMAAAQAGAGSPPGSAGFPFSILEDGTATAPVTAGRTMNALPVFTRLIGDTVDYNFSALQVAAEGWLQSDIERYLYFSGQHPDIDDHEQDSIWELVEYWLDRNDANGGESGALERAAGNALVALTMLCPRQLSWVTNPTQ